MAYPPHGSAQKERIRFALCCVAVLLRRFLYQRAGGCLAVWNGKGERSVPISRRLFSPKSEDSPHQSCLQPFPNILVNAIIDIAALVVELPHGKTCYVAAEMLQDHFHSVRVAFARRQNNGIGNKGIFRVVVLITIRSIHQRVPPNISLTVQKSLSVLYRAARRIEHFSDFHVSHALEIVQKYSSSLFFRQGAYCFKQ